MAFNTNEWNGPKMVETPNIEEDIELYLGREILEKWKTSKNADLKTLTVFITERLEFISILKSIAMLVRRKSKRTVKQEGNNIRVHFECKLFGHNYAGIQFDIEALDYYLHLSCIDAIQSQPQFHSAFQWLKNNVTKYENKDSKELFRLLTDNEKKYSEEFGLSKNFIKAFTQDITPKLQEKICDVLIVLKIKDGQITDESLVAWEKRTVKEKLHKIANMLYGLRSAYTHKNIRSFLPSSDLKTIPDLNGEYLLCKKCNPMDILLSEVIQNLCLQKYTK